MNSLSWGSLEKGRDDSRESIPPLSPLVLQFMKQDSARESVSRASEKTSSSSPSPFSLPLPRRSSVAGASDAAVVVFRSVFESSIDLSDFDKISLREEADVARAADVREADEAMQTRGRSTGSGGGSP